MQKKKTNPLKMLLPLVQGALIGTGAILPGVSGGVLCVSFGVYELMMEFFVHPIKSLKKNYKLFIPLGIGGLIGFVLLAKLIDGLLAAFSVAALALFSGLISGTVPGLIKNAIDSDHKTSWAGFIITVIASFTLFHILEAGMGGDIQPNFWWYVFCGAIWALSMVVPGLSSSSVLLFMGLYQPMAAGIGNLDFSVLIPLFIGFVAAILLLARVVNMLLEKFYPIVSRIIIGFVISSVLMITPTEFAGAGQIIAAVLCFAGGFAVSMIMDYFKEKQDIKD